MLKSAQDVGQSILESYSRVIESLAHTISSRIEDVLDADSVAVNNPSMDESDMEKYNSSPETETVSAMTLHDFMRLSPTEGLNFLQNMSGDFDEENHKENEQKGSHKSHKHKHKHKKINYKIENLHVMKNRH